MAFELPAEFRQLTSGAYATAEPALAEGEYDQLNEDLHYMWTRERAYLGGHAWDPPAQFTDPGLTATTDNSTRRNLDTLHPGGLVRREDVDDKVRLQVKAHLQEINLEAELVRLDTDGSEHTLATKTKSQGATADVVEIDYAIPKTDVTDGASGSPVVPVYLKFRAESTGDGVTGDVRQIAVVEQSDVLGALDIPGSVDVQSVTVSATGVGEADVTPSPYEVHTASATMTGSFETTSSPTAYKRVTASADGIGEADVSPTLRCRVSASAAGVGEASVTPTKIEGAYLLGTGDANESKYGPTETNETLPDIDTDAYGETALVEYIVGQDVYSDPNIDPHIALGHGGFEDGTLNNELASSDYSRGSVTFYAPSQVSRNGEQVYAAPNNGQVTASIESGATVTFDSVAIVDGSSVGSGAVVSWFQVPEQTTSSDVTFADQEFELLSGFQDLSLYMNELVCYALIGAADNAVMPTSTITPHLTLFDADPGQSGSTNEIAGSRVDVTSWSDVGQKNERHAWENDNSFTVSVPDGVDATHIGIYDGDQGSGANQLIAGSLGEPLTPDANNDITFDAGSIRVAAG